MVTKHSKQRITAVRLFVYKNMYSWTLDAQVRRW